MQVFHRISSDSLYRNSLFTLFSTGVTAGLGFIFWMIAARLYDPLQIGIASALVSASGIIASLSLLGLNNSILRYLPTSKRPQELFGSSLIAVLTVCIIGGLIAGIFFPLLSPRIGFVTHSIWLLLVFTIFSACIAANVIIDSVFMANRSTQHVLIRNILQSCMKLVLPILLVSLGSFGLFSALGLGSLAALLLGILILSKHFNLSFRPIVDRHTMRPMLSFSGANYFVSMLGSLPGFLLPIIIVNRLGAEQAAYYYVAFLIASMLFVIPAGIASTVLAEGSYYDSKQSNQRKSLIFIYAVLLPLVIFICLFGSFILHFFGFNYANQSTSALQILAISSLFSAFNYSRAAILNIRHQIYRLVIVHVIEAVSVLICVLSFLSIGINGVALGWLVGQAIMSISYLCINAIPFRSKLLPLTVTAK